MNDGTPVADDELDDIVDDDDDDEEEEESNLEVLKEDQKYHQNISFGQLGFVFAF